MDPALPTLPAMEAHAAEIVKAAASLGSRLHPDTLGAVSDLLRTVNCYYSNLIEGHDTHPVDIDRAMHQTYSKDPRKRALQVEAKAHIEVQLLIEEELAQAPDRNVCAPEFLRWVHREFYRRLPPELRTVRSPSGDRELTVEPGEIRGYDVRVGDHLPPQPAELEALLERFGRTYDPESRSPAEGLVLAGAAHHRLLWIHPFGDGNGRVTRLMTDAYLRRVGVGGHGLWTASRGLARARERYRDALAAADQVRWNDYDGRGPLSLKALGDFCAFFLDICHDQVTYMGGLLDVDRLIDRVQTYGRARAAGAITGVEPHFRDEAGLLLENLVYRGSVPRSEVPRLLRLEERTARRVVRSLVDEGFIVSATSRAPLRLRIPAHAAPYLFPDLYQAKPL